MKTLLVILSLCWCAAVFAQPFKPDISGKVSGDAFKNFCVKHRYSLIGSFDSLPGEKKGMAAQVVKDGKWIYVDLNGKEFNDHKTLAQFYGFYVEPDRYWDDEMPRGWEPELPEPIPMKGNYPYTGTFGKDHAIGYKIQDKVMVPAKYDDVDHLWNEDNYAFFLVRIGNLYGLCDYQGNEITPVIYEKLERLHFGTKECYFIATKGNKKGILSRGGKITIPVEYDEISPESAGTDKVFVVWKNGLKGVISLNGKTILETEYQSIQVGGNDKIRGFVIEKDGKYGYYNKAGVLKVPFEYFSLYYQDGDFLVYSVERNQGALDTNGTKLLAPIYSSIIKPKKGNCFIVAENINGTKKTGIFDLTGKMIEAPSFSSCYAWGNEYPGTETYVFNEFNNYSTGLFNVKTLKWLLPCEYSIRARAEQYMIVSKLDTTKTDSLSWGLVDATGAFIIPCIYSDLKYNDLEKNAIVLLNGKYGLVSSTNQPILPFQYERLSSLAYMVMGYRERIPKGYLIFSQGEQKGVMTTAGKITIPAKYESIDVTSSGLICVSGDTSSIITAGGKIVQTVPHRVDYRLEGMFFWREGSTLNGMDVYGNTAEAPPKPRSYENDDIFPDPPPPAPKTPESDEKIYGEVEEPAAYPGGNEAMFKFLAEHIKYPQSAEELGIQGKCYLNLTIEKDGSISAVKVLKKLPDCPECDAEAIRVVKLMPKWTPAKIEGKAIRSSFNLPVKFKLQ